jgi:hypothetical protein
MGPLPTIESFLVCRGLAKFLLLNYVQSLRLLGLRHGCLE